MWQENKRKLDVWSEIVWKWVIHTWILKQAVGGRLPWLTHTHWKGNVTTGVSQTGSAIQTHSKGKKNVMLQHRLCSVVSRSLCYSTLRLNRSESGCGVIRPDGFSYFFLIFLVCTSCLLSPAPSFSPQTRLTFLMAFRSFFTCHNPFLMCNTQLHWPKHIVCIIIRREANIAITRNQISEVLLSQLKQLRIIPARTLTKSLSLCAVWIWLRLRCQRSVPSGRFEFKQTTVLQQAHKQRGFCRRSATTDCYPLHVW